MLGKFVFRTMQATAYGLIVAGFTVNLLNLGGVQVG